MSYRRQCIFLCLHYHETRLLGPLARVSNIAFLLLRFQNRSAFFRATQRWRLTFTSSISTSGTNVKPSGSNTKDKALDEQGDTENATTNVENCHLMVYRTIDENGGTIDSRTVSTVI